MVCGRYIYIYIYIYIDDVYIADIYIYIYIERERERERETHVKWAVLWFNVPETWTYSANVELQQNLTSSRTQNRL